MSPYPCCLVNKDTKHDWKVYPQKDAGQSTLFIFTLVWILQYSCEQIHNETDNSIFLIQKLFYDVFIVTCLVFMFVHLCMPSYLCLEFYIMFIHVQHAYHHIIITTVWHLNQKYLALELFSVYHTVWMAQQSECLKIVQCSQSGKVTNGCHNLKI